ncbi:hypothetical protein [Herpetosiphon geysericola]|uniref:Uncharacterized protein n=1 Tax=Herpetosiphon geysericola TaxID=70996 RepID=A0A0P6YDD4_9CHLR|nr:hypothetical protein [Herpetosiphon geysericola]KPL90019.1 hypothetical protein SE18_08690 [Herpetosiphon geysericola]
MRYTPEQKAALQTKMVEAHEAKQAAWLEQQANTRLADLQEANLARHAMINDWHDLVSPELLQLAVTEEWLVDYEHGYILIECCLDAKTDTPLVLEYEGEVLEIYKSEDHYYLRRLPSESRIGAPETPAAAEQEVWEYFGRWLLDQAAAERKEQAQEIAFEDAIAPVLDAVLTELEKACRKHGAIRNQHELYAVLLEELEEFWVEVKKAQNSAVLSADAIKELVQIAAMGLRGLLDLGAFTQQ